MFTAPGWVGRKRAQAYKLLGWSPSVCAERRRCARNLVRAVARIQPDVINLHGFNEWSEPGLPREVVAALARLAPVVWTLHDMWPLNGRLDYYGPELSLAEPKPDPATQERLASCGDRLVFACPSRWMAERARAAFPGLRAEVLPNGIDPQIFQPMDRQAARRVLHLSEHQPTILAVAVNLNDQRKGMDLLLQALAALPAEVQLVLIGNADRSVTDPRVRYLGYLNDPRLLRVAYAAADVVAVPSRLDNLPNILLEAIACGTPCVGFAVGGIPDVIRPGETGWLARSGDGADLALQLRKVLEASPEERERLARSCRATAERDYHLSVQAAAYGALFARMTGRGVGAVA
jgi:glycosyltransferase involved in cell wall biosynthesis